MRRFAATLIATIAIATTACAQLHPPTGSADYDAANAAMFHEGDLLTIQVNMAPADLTAMLADPWNEVEYPCYIRVSNKVLDETVQDVRIKIHGSTSRNSMKKSFRIAFNSVVKGTRFHGVKKLNIIGDQNDVAIVRAKVALDALRTFGIASQRAATVHFRINDGARVNDIYIGEEPVDDIFLGAWFGADTGNLYKCAYKGARADLRYVDPGDAAAYQNLGGGATYEEDNNENSPNYTDLADFIRFINKSSDADFVLHLGDYLNVDGFLRLMAADVILGQWDDIWYGANNYYLYHNPLTNHFEFLPYDYDNTLGIDFFSVDWARRPVKNWGSGGFGSNPDVSPLVRRVLNVPAWEGQMRRYIRDLVGAPRQISAGTNYSDTAGDTFCSPANPQLDLLSANVANDSSAVTLSLQLAGPVGVGPGTDYTQFMLFFHTRSGGSTSNPWGRAITTATASDRCLGAWANGAGGFQFYQDTGLGSWAMKYDSSGATGGVGIDLSGGQTGIVRFVIPLAALGVSAGQSFTFDAVTMQNRASGPVAGMDHLSNKSVATPDLDTPSVAGEYVAYTVQSAPTASPNALFSLTRMGPKVDQLKGLALPFAYQGPLAGPTMDWGYTAADFAASFDSPTNYQNPGRPWNWGIKPYIGARAAYLLANVASAAPLPPICINEVLGSNASVNRDETGRYGDWIELYNTSTDAVNIGGMYLSNYPGDPRKWRIPDGTTIAPHGFQLIWADEQPTHGAMHANFTIAAAGQTIALFATDANMNLMVDSLVCPLTGSNVSYGRFPDGSTDTMAFTTVTPSAPNDTTPRTITWPPVPTVYINEFMASNATTIADEFGEHDDWIELYNAGIEAVDLGGRFLTDSLSNPTKFRIPDGTMIPSGGHLIFWADDVPAQGPLHMPYKLSAGGEEIGLFDREDAGLQPIDSLKFGPQATDVSMGRPCDGEPGMSIQPHPTPGATNAGIGCTAICPSFTESPSSAIVTVGGRLTLTFSVAGTMPMSIRWRKGQVEIQDGPTVTGSRTPRLVIPSASLDDIGDYDVALTNSCGTKISSAASILVRPYSLSDVRDALTVAAGLQSSELEDSAWLDADQDKAVTVLDAVSMLRRVI